MNPNSLKFDRIGSINPITQSVSIWRQFSPFNDRRRMSPRPEHLRLCHLLDVSLRPFHDVESNSLTEELERELLISLSKVIRKIRHWTRELDSDEEQLVRSVDESECAVAATLYADNGHCLAKIVTDLISLLVVNSQYTQHLVGNTLVAVSEYVVASGSGWEDFMYFCCLFLELATRCTLSSSEYGAFEIRYPDHCLSIKKLFSKHQFCGTNWFVMTAILRVLRGILKYLKQDIDDEIMKVYMDSVSTLVLNVPWGLLGDIYVGRDIEVLKVSAKDASLNTKVVRPREITVFLGHFLQFLCSIVEQSSYLETGVGSSPVISKIINLIPKFVGLVHAELQSPHHVRVIHYFRHKVLMLMIKLSSRVPLEDSILLSWLHVLYDYFEDILVQPVSEMKIDQDCSLEGQPFCSSFLHPGKRIISSCHLQRLMIFLFLRCSIRLIGVKSTDEQCTCENLKKYFISDQKFDSECCSRSKGLREFHKWLQAHISPDIIMSHELYFQQCLKFTSSFLKLFMHEDDILFEMLLQLFCMPFSLKNQNTETRPFSEAKNDLIVIAADLFNPINLFHLFLAEIFYDHQVLLDYLISKDTGSSCAEYLLRSLRFACNSWDLFVEYPGLEESSDQLCSKRQKVLTHNLDFKKHTQGHAYSSNCSINYRSPFMAARDCLLSLRASIDGLNQKNLFPYNPRVLLRRLMRFEELCFEE